jgi:molecular chaperone GrpE (heat shock protein)
MGGVNKLILNINLDKNLEMFVDKSDQKIKAFSEYATKIKFVYDQIEEISQRLELMDFAIKGYVFDQSRSNDHFSITLSTIE